MRKIIALTFILAAAIPATAVDMVIEKTDGSTIVIDMDEIRRITYEDPSNPDHMRNREPQKLNEYVSVDLLNSVNMLHGGLYGGNDTYFFNGTPFIGFMDGELGFIAVSNKMQLDQLEEIEDFSYQEFLDSGQDLPFSFVLLVAEVYHSISPGTYDGYLMYINITESMVSMIEEEEITLTITVSGDIGNYIEGTFRGDNVTLLRTPITLGTAPGPPSIEETSVTGSFRIRHDSLEGADEVL